MSMAVYVIVAIVIILVVAVVTALAAGNVSVQKYKREEEAKVGNAEEKARVIIDEALKTAETKNAKLCWKLRKKRLRTKMRLNVNPKKEEQRFSGMRNVYCRKRKLWIRKLMY